MLHDPWRINKNLPNVSPYKLPNSPKPLSANGKRKFLCDTKRITKKGN